ncbi:hypothetical protein ACE193_16770 [Bernardetia sp. OM2101]|uniref:hypothetical protein n=1 Tax=Bernardetia sp. OM2101 TaxID=3344876 RepID=UPI0035CF9777
MNTQKISLQIFLIPIFFFCFSSLFAQSDFPKEVQDWILKADTEEERTSTNKSYVYQNEYGEKYTVYFRSQRMKDKQKEIENPISVSIYPYSEERKLPNWKVIYYMDFDGNLVYINYETNHKEYANFRQEIVVKEGKEWYHKISKKEKDAKDFETQSVGKGAIQDEIEFPYFLTKTDVIAFLKPRLVTETDLFKPFFMQRESNFIYNSELPKSVSINGNSKEYSFGAFEGEELKKKITINYQEATDKTTISGMLTPFDGFSFELEGYVSLIGLQGKYIVLEGTGVDSSFEMLVYSEEKASIVFKKQVSGVYFFNNHLIFSKHASESETQYAINHGSCEEEETGMSVEKHGIYDAGTLNELSTDDIPIRFTNQIRCLLVQ